MAMTGGPQVSVKGERRRRTKHGRDLIGSEWVEAVVQLGASQKKEEGRNEPVSSFLFSKFFSFF
jgi:hypothetical protein